MIIKITFARQISFPLFLLAAGLGDLQPCAGQSETWTATGSLATARALYTATLLPNGKVLAAGGFPIGTSAELYAPALGSWAATGSLVTDRYSHTATLLPDGKVLVAGGFNGTDGPLVSAELYDPAAGTWSMTGSLNTARWSHTATLLPNGKVLVAGNYDTSLKSEELYDPASGTWAATGSLITERYYHTATLLPDGKVLVAGGFNYQNFRDLASAELYDPVSGTWTATGSLVTARDSHTATLLPDGKVLVTGGEDNVKKVDLASAELYDPGSGTWTATGSLGTARDSHTATLLPNSQVLVAGGFSYRISKELASAELYDAASGTWAATGNLIAGRYYHTATLLPDGNVLAAGGTTFRSYLASAELYTPSIGAQGYRDTIRADNPMMYWRLGETSGDIAYDETANHRDATFVHRPILGRPGAITNDPDTSVGFNGFNQMAKWEPTSTYTGAFTVEAWVRPRDLHPVETFFCTRTQSAEFSFDFKLDNLAGKEIRFDIGDGRQWLSTAALAFDFQPHVWYYVVAVVTSTGATYYVDGSEIGSVSYSGNPLLFDSQHKVQIGTNKRYDTEWFDGSIDEVAVYDYALTAEQIAAHYAAGVGPVAR